MRRTLPFLFLAVLLCSLSLPVGASTLRAGETIKLTSPIRDNAYIVGSQVTIDQPVLGDLIVAGANVVIPANVREDILAAGGTVMVQGNTGGDVRIAGGTVLISGDVQGDLVIAGGTVTVTDGSLIRGDVLIAGGTVVLSGGITGNVIVRGGTVTIGGVVKGNVDARADDVSITGSVDGFVVMAGKTLSIDSTGRVMKDVRYWNHKDQGATLLAAGAQVKGTVTLDPTLQIVSVSKERAEESFFGSLAVAIVGAGGYLLLSAALVILLLQLLTKTFFGDAARFLVKNPWTSFGYGFVYFAATPVAALLFLLSIIGIPVSFLIATLYVFSLIFTKPITALLLAHAIQLKKGAKWHGVVMFCVSILLYVALKIAGLIPVLGWLVCLVTIFFAYGAVMQTKWAKWVKVR